MCIEAGPPLTAFLTHTQLDYIPDTYAYGRELEKEMKKEAKAKMGKAFISQGRSGQGIVPIPPASPGVCTYKL